MNKLKHAPLAIAGFLVGAAVASLAAVGYAVGYVGGIAFVGGLTGFRSACHHLSKPSPSGDA